MNFDRLVKAFPPPKFLDFPYVGLSISDKSIYGIQFRRRKNSLSVEKYVKKEIPDGVVWSGQINDENAIIETLKDLRKELNTSFVRVSLPEEKAYLFTAKIPRVTEEEIRSAIESKIEENVPVSPSELLFDYKIIDSSQNDYMIVSVSTLPISLVNIYVNIFDKAGLTLLSLEIESQAIARALIPEKVNADLNTVLIVNFAPEKFGLYVVVNRVVHFTSTVSIKGQSSETPDFVSEEIKKLFVYWHALKQNIGKPEKKIKQIIVCGSGFNEDIVLYLSTNNEIPTVLGNVWTNAFDISTEVPDISFKDSLEYATSVGLALPSSFLI